MMQVVSIHISIGVSPISTSTWSGVILHINHKTYTFPRSIIQLFPVNWKVEYALYYHGWNFSIMSNILVINMARKIISYKQASLNATNAISNSYCDYHWQCLFAWQEKALKRRFLPPERRLVHHDPTALLQLWSKWVTFEHAFTRWFIKAGGLL